MGCNGCSNGRGDYNVPSGCGSEGSCGTGGCNKLNVFDWLAGVEGPANQEKFDIVEVRFKNDRKDFYRNVDKIPLEVGDLVATEASPGHDIGTVSLTGDLVRLQMIKKGLDWQKQDVKKIYRKARQGDIEKWQLASSLEKQTMMKARTHADNLGLDMKIGDVEYQGDKTKATFYYIADGRVDFRQLIKLYAEDFKIRVEMRQIGARQEASKIGGIGACGRELCCSSWLTNFKSVTTQAARYQQLSLNPQKLAGQCGKLKCCLNFELDSYLDAIRHFPKNDVKLKTKKGDAYHVKTDIFKGIMWYVQSDESHVFVPLPKERVKEILAMNEKGKYPEDLKDFSLEVVEEEKMDYENVVGQDDLTRFDRNKKGNRKSGNRNKRKNNNQNRGNQNNPQGQNKGQKSTQNNKQKSNNKQEGKANDPQSKVKSGNTGNRKPNNKNRKPFKKRNNSGNNDQAKKPENN